MTQNQLLNSTPLRCHVVRGYEGIGEVFTGTLTYLQFCEYFGVADTNIDELDKMQRDTAKGRRKSIAAYLTDREDTVFPSVTSVSTRLHFEPLGEATLNGVSQAGVLTLPVDAETILVDGQGRRLGVEDALVIAEKLCTDKSDKLRNYTIDMKFIASNTNTLLDAKEFIRQIFSDYHFRVKKPTTSINIFFDSKSQSSNFVMQSYHYIRDNDLGFDKLISLEGNNKTVYTLAQFRTFLKAFTGLSEKAMNESLADESLCSMILDNLGKFIKVLNTIDDFANLDPDSITEVATAKKESLLCCAIGLESLGMLFQLLADKAITTSSPINWSSLDGINDIDFSKKNLDLWKHGVITADGKMIKGSSKVMTKLIAATLNIPLTINFSI